MKQAHATGKVRPAEAAGVAEAVLSKVASQLIYPGFLILLPSLLEAVAVSSPHPFPSLLPSPSYKSPCTVIGISSTVAFSKEATTFNVTPFTFPFT
jgi:hypothetical protein